MPYYVVSGMVSLLLVVAQTLAAVTDKTTLQVAFNSDNQHFKSSLPRYLCVVIFLRILEQQIFY